MKWRIQFIVLVMFMSCLVIGGIHLAEKGIHRVEGLDHEPKQSFDITRAEHGKLEMTVLGRQYSLEQDIIPERSSPPPSERPSENWASKIGNEVGTWMTLASQKLMGWLLG
ncbi:DUF3679 domain-containing protein [Ammoniphilus sp. YIM 78166]|uniref:DUF3679 domain-containing protein n=1 Tax=Ammoniphilus sp. YIM 78166 TaxID=1644106 RepID=UPI00142FD23E|nr:DUF3679 domain-containing protein [Ammoniphilus sp. YIM 78166]